MSSITRLSLSVLPEAEERGRENRRNGEPPVNLMEPPRGSRTPDRPTFTDRENGIEITLVEETGHSCTIRIGRVRPRP